uniref:Transposase n=1 Tax=Heterorhabditis bacteriophora TaxID=37862 RepID=A0A1I7WTR0_HETBA
MNTLKFDLNNGTTTVAVKKTSNKETQESSYVIDPTIISTTLQKRCSLHFMKNLSDLI